MRDVLLLAALSVSLLSGCADSPAPAGTIPAQREGFYAFQNFVANWDLAKHPVLYAVIRTPEEYDRIYHPAGVMGATRPYAPEETFFQDRQILLVCRTVDELDEKQFVLEGVEEIGNELSVRYRYTGPFHGERGRYKMPFAVYVPKKDYARVRFIENGATLGVLELAAGQWAVPPPRPSWREQMRAR